MILEPLRDDLGLQNTVEPLFNVVHKTDEKRCPTEIVA